MAVISDAAVCRSVNTACMPGLGASREELQKGEGERVQRKRPGRGSRCFCGGECFFAGGVCVCMIVVGVGEWGHWVKDTSLDSVAAGKGGDGGDGGGR